MIWCCPCCHSDLKTEGEGLQCAGCRLRYETVAGIPDLRVPGDSWIDFEDDLKSARRLAALECSLPELVREIYAMRPGWDDARIDRRTREVLAAPAKLRDDVTGWLSPIAERKGTVLDLGCGAGMLIAALPREGTTAIGIDVSMTWLVAAKRLVAEFGGVPILAAALGEALPLRRDSLDGAISLDVIEHVRDPDTYLSEIDRVVRPGGRVALSTPNRFSLTAEPHVFVWGVGWLPTRWQSRYVRWRSGRIYDDTRLMSSFGLGKRLRKNTSFDFKIMVPEVPEANLASFRSSKAKLARAYNVLTRVGAMRAILLLIAPFFRVTGVKQSHNIP